MTLNAYLEKKHPINISLDQIYHELQMDKEDLKDHRIVTACIKKHLKLHSGDWIPSHVSTSRGISIITEILDL